MSKEYVVSVGRERIEEGFSGTLDRNTHQPVKKETVMIPVGGYFLPSVSMAWGQRLINGKPRADKSTISATDNDYKGEIKFMEWGSTGGERILIQFLDGCSSLDKVYQEKRLNLVPSNEEGSILLAQGENRFNFDSDETRIAFLKVSSMNKNSKSKDPKIEGFVFTEVDDKYRYNEKDVTAIEDENAATGLVIQNSNSPENLKVIFTIMGGKKVFDDVNDERNVIQIYPALLRLAKNNPPLFKGNLDKYNRSVSELFMKGETFTLLDYTMDGTISISINGKKKVVIDNVPTKGEAMRDWVMANYYDARVYSAMQNLEADLKNIK